MNYSVIKEFDIANGPGCRTTLFVSGCRNHCKGCFQPETWDFGYGVPFDESAQSAVLDSLAPDYVQGLTLLGGDPFEAENQEALTPLLEAVRQRYGNTKDIWAYTGYVYESDLTEGGRRHTGFTGRMRRCIDILVDGAFVVEQKNICLQFRGSENQRILDVKKTIEAGHGVLAEGYGQ